MPNPDLITAADLEHVPELPLGLPPVDDLHAPLPRNLPLPVLGRDLDAARDCAAILDGLEAPQVARLVRWLVARYDLVDLW